MKNIYFTIGPTVNHPNLLEYLNAASKNDIFSISHRSSTFLGIYKSAVSQLKKLMGIPKSYHVFFLSSSLEAMERIIENTVFRHSFHIINGTFSKKFYEIALLTKKYPFKKELKTDSDYDFSKIQVPEKAELICITQNETSNGIAINPLQINIIKDLYPDKLIAVDIVSSAPNVRIDFEKIDMAFFSVQKGFGLPAGQAALVINEKALSKARVLQKNGERIGSYHNFLSLAEKESINQTPETPNVLSIYLLSKVTGEFIKKGLKNIRRETDRKAGMIYDYFDLHKKFKPYVNNMALRSKTTIVIDVRGQSKKIIRYLKDKGIIVGAGYGENKANHIRIANFPSHTLSHVKKLLSAFDKMKS